MRSILYLAISVLIAVFASGCEPTPTTFYVNQEEFVGPGVYVDIETRIEDGEITVRGDVANLTDRDFFYEEMTVQKGEYRDHVFREDVSEDAMDRFLSWRPGPSGFSSWTCPADSHKKVRCLAASLKNYQATLARSRAGEGIGFACKDIVGFTGFRETFKPPAVWVENIIAQSTLDSRVLIRYYDQNTRRWTDKTIPVPITVIFDPPMEE